MNKVILDLVDIYIYRDRFETAVGGAEDLETMEAEAGDSATC